MNWKNIYQGINILLIVLFSIKIYFISQYGISVLLNVLGFIDFIGIVFYFVYIKTLNNQITENEQNKTLKVLEYITYVFIAIDAFQLLRNIILIIANPSILKMNLWPFITLSHLFLICLIITAYTIRRKLLGKFNTNDGNGKIVYNLESLKLKSYETNEQRLELCKICTKREFNRDIGLVCSLTKSKPNFNSMCKEYNRDSKAYEEWLSRNSKNEKNNQRNPIWGYIVIGVIILRIILKIIQYNR